MSLCMQKMRLAWEEPFGPVVPVIRVKSIDEAIEHCNTNNLALQVNAWQQQLICGCPALR